MSTLKLHLHAITASDAYKALGWLVVLLVAGAALTVLPLAWLAIGLLALIAGTLILIKPQLALYLLCFAVPFGSLLSVDLGGISLGIADVLLALTAALWLARAIAYRQAIRWPRLALPVLLFAGSGAFSLLHAQSLPLAAKELAKWIEFLIIVVIVSDLSSRSRQQNRAVVACLLLAGIAQAVLGAYQFFTRSGPEFFAFGRFMRAYGTFEQPNPFGGYVGMIAPLALALTLCPRSRAIPWWLKWLATTSLVATGAGLVMSGSRGAWLGASAAIGVVAVLRGRQGQVVLLLVILLAALAGVFGGSSLIPDQILERITGFLPLVAGLGTSADVRSFEVTDANYANLERLAFWRAAVSMWAERPWLGVGIGNYQTAYPQHALPKWRMSLGHAHNYYLNIAAETGLIGLLTYLALWTVVIWRLAQTIRQAQSTYNKALALGALGVVIHVSVHNVVDNLWVHHMYVHVAILLGLAQAHSTLAGSTAAAEPAR